VKSKKIEEKRCCSCLSLIARPHQFNLSTRLRNIKNYISDSASNKFKEQVISSLVKDKVTDEHKTKSATLSLIQANGGQSLTIVVKPTKTEQGSSKQQQSLSCYQFFFNNKKNYVIRENGHHF
jgi:hypothetical protein